VSAAYWLEPQTQTWLRYFDGHPQISNLATVDGMQAMLTLAATATTAAQLTVGLIDVRQGGQ